MRFWHPGRVATGLREGQLSEADKARYLAASFVIRSCVGQISHRSMVSVIHLGVFLIGLAWCYRANMQGDGQRFIERYLCLSLPLVVWILGLYLVPYYGTYFVLRWTGHAVPAETYQIVAHPYIIGANFLLTIMYYVVLGYYMRQVARNDPN
jgi:hypothetical protein